MKIFFIKYLFSIINLVSNDKCFLINNSVYMARVIQRIKKNHAIQTLQDIQWYMYIYVQAILPHLYIKADLSIKARKECPICVASIVSWPLYNSHLPMKYFLVLWVAFIDCIPSSAIHNRMNKLFLVSLTWLLLGWWENNPYQICLLQYIKLSVVIFKLFHCFNPILIQKTHQFLY